jgi:hypothetical protein
MDTRDHPDVWDDPPPLPIWMHFQGGAVFIDARSGMIQDDALIYNCRLIENNAQVSFIQCGL